MTKHHRRENPLEVIHTGLFGPDGDAEADPWLIAGHRVEYQRIPIVEGERWFWKDHRFMIVSGHGDEDGGDDNVVIVEYDGVNEAIGATWDEMKNGIGPRVIARRCREAKQAEKGK